MFSFVLRSLVFVSVFLSFTGVAADAASESNDDKSSAAIVANTNNVRHNPYPIQPPYDSIYSHAVEVSGKGRYLHVSGQLGFSESGELPESFKGQTIAAIENIERVLSSADMSLADIVHMRFLITDRSQVDDLVNVRVEKLGGLAPAVTTFVVHGLLKEEWLIEIEAVAFK